MKPRNPRSIPSACRGLTLVELMLAVMITALIGAATASMIAAVSYGTDSSKDIRSLVGRNKAINARVSAAIRGCRLVLDATPHSVVLWTDDLDDDEQPSLHELRLIEFDPQTGELASYRAAPNSTDVSYDLDSDFLAITAALKAGSSFPRELWATGITSWEVVLDHDDPQRARLISYRIELRANDLSDVAIAAVSLRNAINP